MEIKVVYQVTAKTRVGGGTENFHQFDDIESALAFCSKFLSVRVIPITAEHAIEVAKEAERTGNERLCAACYRNGIGKTTRIDAIL